MSWLILTLVLLGCNRDEAVTGESAAAKSEPSSKAQDGPGGCGGADRPCTWGEVSDATVARIQDVADLAVKTLREGKSPKQVADALRAEADVSVLSATDEMIRYHVKGGRPAWVWLVSSKRRPTIGVPIAIPMTLALGEPKAPAGEQTPGKKPKKTALILSPFRWQWQLGTKWAQRYGKNAEEKSYVMDDETETLEKHFGSVPDYKGGVTRKENRLDGDSIAFGMGVTDFASWGTYDVVHLSTHGTSCAAGATDCEPALATGDLLVLPGTKEERNALLKHYNRSGVDVGFMPFSEHQTEVDMAAKLTPGLRFKQGAADGKTMDGAGAYTAGPFMLLTSTWFKDKYGSKLADKIIFLSACSSGSQANKLPKALAGPATAVIGWDKTMSLYTATVGANYFWALALGYEHEFVLSKPPKNVDADEENLLPGGLTVEQVFERLNDTMSEATFTKGPLKSIVIEGVLAEDDATGAKLHPDGDTKTRAREIVSLVHGNKKRNLQDGDLVGLEGAPGDGEPDKLRLIADVIGIDEDEDPGDYVIGIDVDGQSAAETFKPTEKIQAGKWRGEATIDLGFDLEAGKTFDLEPWVDLPGGGRSRWRYEDIGAEYFAVTISGPGLSGAQTFSIDPRRVSFNAHGGGSFGGFVTMFKDHDARTAVSKDGSVLDWMGGGTSGAGFDKVGEHPLGEGQGGSNGWSMYVWLQAEGCPPRFAGCKAIALSTDKGTIEITKFVLGKAISRPHNEGPTVVTATFEAAAHATNVGPHKDQSYTLKAALSLVD